MLHQSCTFCFHQWFAYTIPLVDARSLPSMCCVYIASINVLRVHFLLWPPMSMSSSVLSYIWAVPQVLSSTAPSLKLKTLCVSQSSDARLYLFFPTSISKTAAASTTISKTAAARHDFESDSLRFPASVCVSHAFPSSCLQDRIRVRSPQLNLRLSIIIIPSWHNQFNLWSLVVTVKE